MFANFAPKKVILLDLLKSRGGRWRQWHKGFDRRSGGSGAMCSSPGRGIWRHAVTQFCWIPGGNRNRSPGSVFWPKCRYEWPGRATTLRKIGRHPRKELNLAPESTLIWDHQQVDKRRFSIHATLTTFEWICILNKNMPYILSWS